MSASAHSKLPRKRRFGKLGNEWNEAVDRVKGRLGGATGASAQSASQSGKPEAAGSDDKGIPTDVKSKIGAFKEYGELLIELLDNVESIHPFVAPVAVAFKSVMKLALARGDNDEKSILLMSKMQDMMRVLSQIRSIEQGKKSQNQESLESSLSPRCVEMKEDIEQCGNLIDVYSKENTFAKYIKAPIYVLRFAAYCETFENHQKEISFKLAIFSTQGIQNANDSLGNIKDNVNPIRKNTDMLLLFQLLQNPIERDMLQFIETKGGPEKCLEDDDLFNKLYGMLNSPLRPTHLRQGSPSPYPTSIPVYVSQSAPPPASAPYYYPGAGASAYYGGPYGSAPLSRQPYSSAIPNYYSSRRTPSSPQNEAEVKTAIRRELETETVDEALRRNRQLFLRKVKYLEDQIIRQGNRIVKEVKKGPHDRIHDQELRRIWEEMRWKLMVPTTEFVLTLHDYYVLQHHDMQILDGYFQGPPPPGSTVADEEMALSKAFEKAKKYSEDKWALDSLNISNLKPIMEAFDADANGYVSVWEANRVVSLKPSNWSLLQWLAYWASGRHFTISNYVDNITRILKDMQILSHTDVLPVNRHGINKYLSSITTLAQILSSTQLCLVPPAGEVVDRATSYSKAEEEKMDRVLHALNYEIDGADTIELITSRYHIERNFFPLVYLLLKRHLLLFHLACKDPLDNREMKDATSSLETIFQAVETRISSLEVVFLQQNITVISAQLQVFAFGMYSSTYMNADVLLPSVSVDETTVSVPTSSTGTMKPKYPIKTRLPHRPVIFIESLAFEKCIGNWINGYWSGYFFHHKGSDLNGIIQFWVLNWKGSTFTGEGSYSKGLFNIEGTFDVERGRVEASVVLKADEYDGGEAESEIRMVWSGRIDAISSALYAFASLPTQYSMRIRWGSSKESINEDSGRVVFAQSPAWSHQFRRGQPYRPSARDRWKWVLEAVLYRVCAEKGKIGTFTEQLSRIRDVVGLFKYEMLIGTLPDRKRDDLDRILRVLPPSDTRMCRWFARNGYWPTVHLQDRCSRCQDTVIGHLIRYKRERASDNEIFCSRCDPNRQLDQREVRVKSPRTILREYWPAIIDKASSLLKLLSESIYEESSSPPSPKIMYGPNQVQFLGPSDSMPPMRTNSRSASPKPPPKDLWCSCCKGVAFPNKKFDLIWLCLICSKQSRESLLCICNNCELLGRPVRITSQGHEKSHTNHRHDHVLVQIRPWGYTSSPHRAAKSARDHVRGAKPDTASAFPPSFQAEDDVNSRLRANMRTPPPPAPRGAEGPTYPTGYYGANDDRGHPPARTRRADRLSYYTAGGGSESDEDS